LPKLPTANISGNNGHLFIQDISTIAAFQPVMGNPGAIPLLGLPGRGINKWRDCYGVYG